MLARTIASGRNDFGNPISGGVIGMLRRTRTNLLGKGLDLLGRTTKTAPLSCNDALGVML
jgi:hypothetical protein